MKKNLQSDEGTEHWSTKDGNQAAKATILNALDNTFEDLKMMELAPPPPHQWRNIWQWKNHHGGLVKMSRWQSKRELNKACYSGKYVSNEFKKQVNFARTEARLFAVQVLESTANLINTHYKDVYSFYDECKEQFRVLSVLRKPRGEWQSKTVESVPWTAR